MQYESIEASKYVCVRARPNESLYAYMHACRRLRALLVATFIKIYMMFFPPSIVSIFSWFIDFFFTKFLLAADRPDNEGHTACKTSTCSHCI